MSKCTRFLTCRSMHVGWMVFGSRRRPWQLALSRHSTLRGMRRGSHPPKLCVTNDTCGTNGSMPKLIASPKRIPVPGNKVVDEYVGRVNTSDEEVSIAH